MILSIIFLTLILPPIFAIFNLHFSIFVSFLCNTPTFSIVFYIYLLFMNKKKSPLKRELQKFISIDCYYIHKLFSPWNPFLLNRVIPIVCVKLIILSFLIKDVLYTF